MALAIDTRHGLMAVAIAVSVLAAVLMIVSIFTWVVDQGFSPAALGLALICGLVTLAALFFAVALA